MNEPVCVCVRMQIHSSPFTSSLSVAKGRSCLRTYVRVEGRMRLDNKPYESSDQSSNILEHSDITYTWSLEKDYNSCGHIENRNDPYPRKFCRKIFNLVCLEIDKKKLHAINLNEQFMFDKLQHNRRGEIYNFL